MSKLERHDLWNLLRGVPDEYRGIAQPMDEVKVFSLMAKSRAIEERLLKASKTEHSYFWIGGPGEEAFNVPLGLLIHKGQGLAYDYLHLHYRSNAILTAMGLPMLNTTRQACSRATDPYSGGRNFVHHYAIPEWNVLPGTSTVETQYAVAPGTALAQRRHGGEGITIVNGGDAGTAEGDFTSCLNWSSRPGHELPILIIVVNNHYGISTPFEEVRGKQSAIQRCGGFGIRWEVIDGNDPYESWKVLSEAIAYVRHTRKPFGIEASTSRLHGHSSSSGGARVEGEIDCLAEFQKVLVDKKLLTNEDADAIHAKFQKEAMDTFQTVIKEPMPLGSTIYDHVFA